MSVKRDIYTPQILRLHAKGLTVNEVSAQCGCSISHVRNIYLKNGIDLSRHAHTPPLLVEGMREFLAIPVPRHL